MKNIFILFLVFILCSTCKKISKYPLNLYGEWCSSSHCEAFIIINLNGQGSIRNADASRECWTPEGWKGKVKYFANTLYIGTRKFHIVEKPKFIYTNDSIRADSPYEDLYGKGKIPVIATMTIRNTFLHDGETIKYYKIKNY